MALLINERIKNPNCCTWEDIVYVGETHVAEILSELFKAHQIQTVAVPDPAFEKGRVGIIFGRDRHIPNFREKHLFPRSLVNPLWKLQIVALYPEHSRSFVVNKITGVGRGFYKHNVEESLQYPKEKGLPFEMASSAIEGGNCALFVNSKGEKKAILGEHSLTLALLSLMENGTFMKPEVQSKVQALLHESKKPKSEFLRRSRNLSLYYGIKELEKEVKFLHLQSIHGQASPKDKEKLANLFRQYQLDFAKYPHALYEPVKHKESYEVAARHLEAWEKIAAEKLAQDLGLALRDITFIPQTEFHIDMGLFVDSAHDTVYLHDEQMAIKLMTSISEKTYSAYIEAAKERHARFGQNTAAAEALLKAQGYQVVRVAAAFEAKGMKTINFMNSIFASTMQGEPVLFTNGANQDHQILERHFEKQVHAHNPRLKIVFVGSGTPLMEDILTDYFGGLHCLTWTGNYEWPD